MDRTTRTLLTLAGLIMAAAMLVMLNQLTSPAHAKHLEARKHNHSHSCASVVANPTDGTCEFYVAKRNQYVNNRPAFKDSYPNQTTYGKRIMRQAADNACHGATYTGPPNHRCPGGRVF